MGWDAYAVDKHGKDVECFSYKHKELPWQIKNEKIRGIFKEAAGKVLKNVGEVDGCLETGSLDCSCFGMEIMDITGYSVYLCCGFYYSPEEVQKMKKIFDEKDPPYSSGRGFVDACVKAGLGMRFSY